MGFNLVTLLCHAYNGTAHVVQLQLEPIDSSSGNVNQTIIKKKIESDSLAEWGPSEASLLGCAQCIVRK